MPWGDRPSDVVGVEAQVAKTSEDVLTARYRVEGDISRLRIPHTAAPGFADGLWWHTCFEMFVTSGGGPAYREFNFAPSGEWAAYEFERYRSDPRALAELPDPNIVIEATQQVFSLTAHVHLQRSGSPSGDRTLWLGVSAVMEDCKGVLSYWALSHPSSKPDFHHPDSFVLQV